MERSPRARIRRLALSTATGADLDSVGRLLRELNLEVEDETPSAQALASRVAELLGDGDAEVLLAEDPPVGIAVVRLRKAIWTAHREASLVELYVSPARRGRELERELVQMAMDVARDRGADFIDLTVGASDVQARRLYEDLGFDDHEVGSQESLALHYERPL
jgi:ribosomal protein S18 acetylase RimI-like enzyme